MRLTAPIRACHAKLLLSPLLAQSLGLPLPLARLPRGMAVVPLSPSRSVRSSRPILVPHKLSL
jgi:hypothetical protein